ncbi:DUF748 domain-containing protein [Candidatus Sumerlaeota bacterium]|nr:DUF748 domain-containing protein [Candidatus Sumerlaeota bacterium]
MNVSVSRNDSKDTLARRRRASGRRKKIAWIVVVLAVLALALYGYVSSSFFFSHWIQPRIEKSLGHSLEIDSVNFSPWGHVVLKNVEMETLPDEKESRLKVAGIDIRFHLLSLLRHRVRIDRFQVDSPAVRVTRDADGSLKGPFPIAADSAGADKSNGSKESSPPKSPTDSDATTRTLEFDWGVEVNDFALRNVSLVVESYEEAWREPRSVTIDSFSLECPRLVLGEDWELKGQGNAALFLPEQAANSPTGEVAVNVKSSSGASGEPASVQTELRIQKVQGTYRGRKLAHPIAILNLKSRFPSPGRIEVSESSFRINAASRTRVRANLAAQWDLATQSGWIRARLRPMDPDILDIVAPSGPDVRTEATRVSGRGYLTIAPGGALDVLDLEGDIANLTPAEANASDSEQDSPSDESEPAVPFASRANAHVSLRFGFPRDDQPAVLKSLDLNVQQADGKKVVEGKLQRPLELDPKTGLPIPGRTGADVLELTIDSLDLRQWGAFLPIAAADFRTGTVSGRLDIGMDATGEGRVRVSGKVDAAGVGGLLSGKAFGPLNVKSNLKAGIGADRRLNLDELAISLASKDAPLGGCRLTGEMGLDPPDGKIDVELQNLQLANIPPGLYQDAGIEIGDGYVNGAVSVRFSPSPSQIELESNLNVGDLAVSNTRGRGEPLKKLDASASGRVVLARGEKGISRLEADAVSLSARLGQRALLTLSASGRLDVEKNQGKVEADCIDLDLLPFLLFQGAAPRDSLPLESILNAHLQVESGPDKALHGVGRLELKPLTFRAAETGGAPSSVSMPFKARFKQTIDTAARQVTIEEFLATVGEKTDKEGRLEATGQIHYGETIAADLQVRASSLRLLPFVAFQPSLATSADLTMAVANAEQSLAFSAKGPSLAAKGTIRVEGIRPPAAPPDAAGKGGAAKATPPAANSLTIGIVDSLSYEKGRLRVDETKIDLIHPGGRTDRIDVKGLPGGEDDSVGGLAVTAKSIDLQPLLPYVGLKPAADAPPLLAEDLALQAAPNAAGADIRDFAVVRIAGGKIACESVSIRKTAAAAAPRIEWKEATGEKLDVYTLLANLSPKNAGRLTGAAEFQTSGAAQGFDEESMRRALRATFHSRVRDGELKGVPLLDELAAATGIAELRQVGFFRFDTDIVADDKAFQVRAVDIEGDLQKIHADGHVRYNEKIDLPLTLALGGKLKERVQREKYARFLQTDEKGYLAFPTPLKVSGTLSKPKIRLEFPTENLLDVGFGVLNQELQKQLDKERKK